MSNVFLQDNQSAIHMEHNGRNSYTLNLIHIYIRFFAKDLVDKEELNTEYCTTHVILANCLQNHCRESYSNGLDS